jgi:hypothetical protein
MTVFKKSVAIALSIGGLLAAGAANAAIINVDYTGTVTYYAGPPGGLSVGDTFADSFQVDTLFTPDPGIPGFTYDVGLSTYGFAFHLVPGPHFFFDFSFTSRRPVFPDLHHLSGLNFSLAGANIGSGDEAFGAGQFFFDVNSVHLTSPVTAVPLPASLPLFSAAVAGLGAFARRRKTSLAFPGLHA